MRCKHDQSVAATVDRGWVRNVVCLGMLVLMVALAGCESPEERINGYVAKAEQFLEEDNLVKAELEAKNALQIDPKSADARFVLAKIAEKRADFGEMAANLRAAVETRPDFVEARVKLGTLYVLGGATDLANEEMAELEKLAPEESSVRILRARMLASRGELEAASVELQAVLQAQPDSTEAMGLLANITAASDVDAALEIVNGAIERTENNRVLRLLKVQLLQRAGDEAAVEAEYRALIRDYPEEPGFSYQLAQFLSTIGRSDDVRAVLNDLVERDAENQQARLALVQFVAGTEGAEAAVALLKEFIGQNADAHELRLVLARQYQLAGDTDAAVAEYRQVVERAGNEDVGLTAKGRIAAIELAQGNLEEGEAIIEDILLVDSMNAEALLLRGALNYDRDKLKAAVSDLRTVLRNNAEDRRAQMLLARSHAKAEDFLLARDAYRRALQLDPRNVRATLELTRILINESEFDKAESVLRDQLSVTPDNIDVSRTLIAVLVSRKRFDDALAEARRVAELPGQQAIGDFLLGGIYQTRDQHEQAVESFRRSLASQPMAREPLQGLVRSLKQLDRSDEAVAFLEQMSRDYPENLYAKTLLGQVVAGTGDTGAAREIFEAALSDNADWLPAYTALAGLASEDPDAQIDVYKRGLAAMPESQELALLLGTAYEREGRYEDAIAAYENVLAGNPDMQVVANNLAALLADYRTDRASFERALELARDFESSDNPALLDTLGWVYHRLGEYDRAQPLLEQAVGAADQVPVLSYHLGMNYLAQGRKDLARQYLARSLEKTALEFPGKAEAIAALAELNGAD